MAETESPKGMQQGLELAERISIAPDLIVVTNHLRTRLTAEPLIKKYPLAKAETLPLHEFTFLSPGLCRNTTPEERLPWVKTYWNKCDPNFVYGQGAESFNQFRGRIQESFERITLLDLKFTIVFTHGHVIRVLKMILDHKAKNPEGSMKYYRDLMLELDIPNISIYEIIL